MNSQVLYLKLLQICRNGPQNLVDRSQIDEIWTSISNLAFQDTNAFISLIPLIEKISFGNQSFTESNPSEISEAINNLKNSSIDIHQRVASSAPLFALFPFLTQSNATSFIENVIDFIENINEDYPEKLINLIDTIEVVSIKENVYSDLFKLFKEKSDSKLFAATLVFSPIANAFLDNVENSIAFSSSLFEKCISTQQKRELISASLLAERLAQTYSVNPISMPAGLFEKLSPLLFHDDSTVQFRAHKAMRRLIEFGVFDQKEKVKALVDQYHKYKTPHLFFKLISKYLEDSDNISLDTIKPIFDFALSNVEDFNISGYLLSIFSFFGTMNSDYIRDIVKPILVTVHQIVIQKKINFYHDATETLFTISKCFGPENINIFTKDIEAIAEILLNEQTSDDLVLSLHKKTLLGQSIALLPISEGTFSLILEFINQNIQKVTCNSIYPICQIVITLFEKFSIEATIDYVNKFVELAAKETDLNRLNAILQTLKKLFKKLIKNSKNEQIINFINKIVNGHLQFFNGLPFVISATNESMIIHFVSVYLRKNIVPSSEILNEIIKYISLVPPLYLPALLESIIYCISTLTTEQCQRVVDGLIPLIPSFDLYSEENDYVLATFDVISAILKVHPETINSVELIQVLDKLTQANEEEDDVSMDIHSLASTMKLICELSLVTPEVNDDLLSSIIDLVPFPEETNGNDAVITTFVQMCQQKDKFANVYLPILAIFVKLVTSFDIGPLKISDENISGMKAALKVACQNDSTLDRQLTKDFTRHQLNRFKTIFK
ncbi:hypothetical protein TRFO_07051 [Tritrichomonas foetus]|uniref:Uncharacterized protein n=1 Tax=Tritrichomonas foetus TaxID=1144522 RepID=A0A1J4JYM0_9EUKA|nr:hypothetical protein TRFO_07051 [Tritrichomonas foetus]|eukprot:OHT02628.1 hypothetical protein TRFO_07051 [Tritrichomonas foetus]